MSVRSFHSVFMASVVAGAALGCYLVSLRVASERAELEKVETRIVLAQRDIRLLQTEIGTRGRLAQLERWNVKVLALSAPSADQILGDKFQLARLVSPERLPAIEAPVVLASAPAAPDRQPLEQSLGEAGGAAPAQLLHEAGLKTAGPAAAPQQAPAKMAARPEPKRATAKPAEPKAAVAKASATKPATAKPAEPETAVAKAPATKPAAGRPTELKVAAAKVPAKDKTAADNKVKEASPAMTRPVRTANVDPLAPLPAGNSTAKASRTDR